MLQGTPADMAAGGPSLPKLYCGSIAGTTDGTKPTSQEASVCEIGRSDVR